ncbi:type II secretion system F family protein [Vibrio jasicida]|uniref:type II secretion system F family protein n=1 Tax=Vibrio jasicida TaxID=766224 RepID=UPI001641F101|nr:type II secretion system F family protein [Vibrio jasicida]
MNLIIVVLFCFSILFSYIVLFLYENIRTRFITNKLIKNNTNYSYKETKIFEFFLNNFSFNKNKTQEILIAGGIYNQSVADMYYLIKIVPSAIVFIVSSFLYLFEVINLLSAFSITSVTLLLFIFSPDAYLSLRRKKNINRISAKLPFLLDLMNICVSAGMTIETSLEYLSKELDSIDKNLAFVVGTTAKRARIIGIEVALKEFYHKVPSSEAHSFVFTLTQSLQFGSSIGPVLTTLATDIRNVNLISTEEIIGSLNAKMTIPLVVFIMFPIVILIVAPGIMRLML